MSLPVVLSAIDLGALLCSRICHDIISPVGAINNGLELLEEGGADEDAMALIVSSARNASARLQFARIAFGAAGSAGVQIDTGDAQNVATSYMQNEKPEFSWTGNRAFLPKNQVKLLLNLVLIGISAIPRGGNLDVVLEDVESKPKISIKVRGRMLRVPPKFKELHEGILPEESVDAHSVQPYYTLLLAQEAGMEIIIDVSEEEIIFRAQLKQIEPAFEGDVTDNTDAGIAADTDTLSDD